MTNIEGNKLIAEFMGAVLEYDPQYNSNAYKYEMDKRPTESSSRWWSPEQMQYHTSWDWLMPVVEKIDIVFFKEMSNANRALYFEEGNNKFWLMPITSNIKIVWQAVIQFIQWYNNQKPIV